MPENRPATTRCLEVEPASQFGRGRIASTVWFCLSPIIVGVLSYAAIQTAYSTVTPKRFASIGGPLETSMSDRSPSVTLVRDRQPSLDGAVGLLKHNDAASQVKAIRFFQTIQDEERSAAQANLRKLLDETLVYYNRLLSAAIPIPIDDRLELVNDTTEARLILLHRAELVAFAMVVVGDSEAASDLESLASHATLGITFRSYWKAAKDGGYCRAPAVLRLNGISGHQARASTRIQPTSPVRSRPTARQKPVPSRAPTETQLLRQAVQQSVADYQGEFPLEFLKQFRMDQIAEFLGQTTHFGYRDDVSRLKHFGGCLAYKPWLGDLAKQYDWATVFFDGEGPELLERWQRVTRAFEAARPLFEADAAYAAHTGTPAYFSPNTTNFAKEKVTVRPFVDSITPLRPEEIKATLEEIQTAITEGESDRAIQLALDRYHKSWADEQRKELDGILSGLDSEVWRGAALAKVRAMDPSPDRVRLLTEIGEIQSAFETIRTLRGFKVVIEEWERLAKHLVLAGDKPNARIAIRSCMQLAGLGSPNEIFRYGRLSGYARIIDDTDLVNECDRKISGMRAGIHQSWYRLSRKVGLAVAGKTDEAFERKEMYYNSGFGAYWAIALGDEARYEKARNLPNVNPSSFDLYHLLAADLLAAETKDQLIEVSLERVRFLPNRKESERVWRAKSVALVATRLAQRSEAKDLQLAEELLNSTDNVPLTTNAYVALAAARAGAGDFSKGMLSKCRPKSEIFLPALLTGFARHKSTPKVAIVP